MSDSIVEKSILSSGFQYLQPFFYNHPYSVRCELGIGDDAETYMQAANRRALEIYRILFPKGADAMFFDNWLYDDCPSEEAEAEQREFMLRFQRQYRHAVVENLKGYEHDETDDSFVGISRVICYSDGKGFDAESILRGQIEDRSKPLVSFVSFDGEFILSVYDDRGCDVVFMTPQAFAARYGSLEPYFLEYDRELMQSRLDAITEKGKDDK